MRCCVAHLPCWYLRISLQGGGSCRRGGGVCDRMPWAGQGAWERRGQNATPACQASGGPLLAPPTHAMAAWPGFRRCRRAAACTLRFLGPAFLVGFLLPAATGDLKPGPLASRLLPLPDRYVVFRACALMRAMTAALRCWACALRRGKRGEGPAGRSSGRLGGAPAAAGQAGTVGTLSRARSAPARPPRVQRGRAGTLQQAGGGKDLPLAVRAPASPLGPSCSEEQTTGRGGLARERGSAGRGRRRCLGLLGASQDASGTPIDRQLHALEIRPPMSTAAATGTGRSGMPSSRRAV